MDAKAHGNWKYDENINLKELYLLIESLYIQMIFIVILEVIVHLNTGQIRALEYALTWIFVFEIIHFIFYEC